MEERTASDPKGKKNHAIDLNKQDLKNFLD